jgi:putative ABC transport system permease protein
MKMTIPDERVTATLETAPAARIVDGVKIYGTGVTAVRALDKISAEFAAGMFTAIMGPSGSGKSTLLHCLAGLDRLTEGHASDALFDIGVNQGRLASMTASGIAVSTQVAGSQHLRIGSPVAVTFPVAGTKTYTVQAIYSVRALAGDYILPLAAAKANFPQALDMVVFVKLAPGVSAAAGRSAIEHVLSSYPNATLMDQTQYKAQVAQQVNTLLNLVYALLALAVVIALIGIANTLALSIYERTRELGLLRAVGTTRGQLRSIVRSEALIISLFGAIEGLALGVVFGWAIVAAMHSQGVTQLSFPVAQLIAVAVLAGLAGIVAAIAPSRRAARLNVLQAVTAE